MNSVTNFTFARIATHLWHGDTWGEPWVEKKKFGTSSDLHRTCVRHWCWVSSCGDIWTSKNETLISFPTLWHSRKLPEVSERSRFVKNTQESRNRSDKSSSETKHEIAVQTAKWRNFFGPKKKPKLRRRNFLFAYFSLAAFSFIFLPCRKIGSLLTCRKHWCAHLPCKLYRPPWVNRWCHHLVSSKTPLRKKKGYTSKMHPVEKAGGP